LTIGRALHRSEVLGTRAVSFSEKLTGLAGRNWFPDNRIRITATSSTTLEETAVQVGVRNPLRLLYLCSAYHLISVYGYYNGLCVELHKPHVVSASPLRGLCAELRKPHVVSASPLLGITLLLLRTLC